jgi:hypothetical protein
MYWEYADQCVKCNPHLFLPIGVKRRWWHIFKAEHPRTSAVIGLENSRVEITGKREGSNQ